MFDQKTAERLCNIIVRRCAGIMFDRGLAGDAAVELTSFDEKKDDFIRDRRFAEWFICPLDSFPQDHNLYHWQGKPDHIKKEGDSVRVIKFRFALDDETFRTIVEFDPVPGEFERFEFTASADDEPEKLKEGWCVITVGRGVRVKS